MTNVAKPMIKRESVKKLSQVIIIWSLESYPQSWKARSSHHDENDPVSIRKGSSSKASYFLSIKDKSSNINDIFHRLFKKNAKIYSLVFNFYPFACEHDHLVMIM